MRFGASFRCAAAVIFFLAATLAHAQAPMAWEARRLLANTSAPGIGLLHNGTRVDVVRRADVERVVEMTERLASAMDMPTPGIFVAKQSGPNAFATVNRSGQPLIAVNTDMLRLTSGDEPMLAAVIGHELAHLKSRHVSDEHLRAAAISILGALLGAAVDINQAKHGRDTGGLGTAVGALGAGLVNAKFSRDQEREADEIGLRAMAQAGFDPGGASRLWRRMGGGGSGGLWLDSHPAHGEREQTLHALAQQVQPVYAANSRQPAAIHPASEAPATDMSDTAPRSAFTRLAPSSTERGDGGAYVRAVLAITDKRFTDAVDPLKEAIAAGDERAMHVLGLVHYRGDLGAYDWGTAKSLFEQAAAKGFAPAMTMLGRMALHGRGGPRDPTEAERQFRRADARDDAAGTGELALLLASGAGVQRDFVQARALAEKAAGNDAQAKGLLGALLRDGNGGPHDAARGFALLTESAPKSSWAKAQLGVSYERGLGVKSQEVVS